MTLNLKTLDQIVTSLTSSWAGLMGLDPNLVSGDPLEAAMFTVATQLVDLEANILDTYYYSKAQTSYGADLDTWMAQYYLTRRPAQQAVGQVQFAMNQVKANAVNIPVGAIIQTLGGAIQYQVIADTNQNSYNASANAYIVPPNTRLCTATVQALLPGSAYNVQVGQLQQLATSIPGIDTVINLNSIVDGTDPETDAQFNIRFQLYINSLSKATFGSFEEVLLSFGENLKFVILENVDVNGNTLYGNVVTVVDDGSGATPTTTLNALATSLDGVRAYSVSQQVRAASQLATGVQLAARISSGTGAVQTLIQTAIINFINALPIGGTLYASDILDIAKNADGPRATSRITAIEMSSILINGSSVDSLTAGSHQVMYATNSGVVVNTY
jgi:uncharacterized phage protein gp47/JayE